jgi:hypothetical protein
MASHSPPPNEAVASFLSHAALAPNQAHKALTVWPLVRRPDAPPPSGPSYVALVDALASGKLQIDEVSEHGRVPHVRVANRGREGVLVLFGEEILGAKQNRIANASFLILAGREVVIDVSCVEQGRWGRERGARFEAGLGVVSSAMRRKMERKVSLSRTRGGRFDADQGEVWDGVQERLTWSGARSRTGAYSDYLATRKTDLQEIGGAFRPVPGQVGFVAAIGGEVIGVEIVGRGEVFERAFQRLLHGYAVDAADAGFLRDEPSRGWRGRRSAPRRFDAPEPFLEALSAAPVASGPSLGEGEDLRIEGNGVAACALAAPDLVHLTAFPLERA